MKIIPPKALAGPRGSSVPAKGKSSAEQLIFFQKGRDAIHYVCRALGIGPGDCVLAPALICRSAVEPIAAVGARVQFVDVAADLDYDQGLLEAALVQYRPKSLLAVHHFGRRPRLERYKELCNQFNSILIEDRCHSLPPTMDFPADIVGDYAIYSLRKFLPVPDGGMLVCRESGLPLLGDYGSLSLGAYGKFLLQHIGKTLFYSGIYNPYAFRQWKKKLERWFGAETCLAPVAKAATHDQSSTYGVPQCSPSRLLTRWLDGRNLSTVIDRHRHNYQQLAISLPPDIVCRPGDEDFETKSIPVALPIVDSSREADLVERLRTLGIGVYAWPGNELPIEVRGRYPEAERLARQLVMLPIHYDLTEADLKHVASVVRVITPVSCSVNSLHKR